MADEEIENVAQQEVVQSSESEQEQPGLQEEAAAPQQTQRRDAEYNWAETRRKLEQQERILREQQELIDKLSKGAQPQEEELSDEDLVTVKQVHKMTAKEREGYNKKLRDLEAALVDTKIKNQFSDFDQVVNPETIDLLNKNEPEMAKYFKRMEDDPYTQMAAAYKYMKNAGYGPKVAPVEKKKALDNSQKPLSVNAVTKQSAIGNAHMFENGLTPELKKQLYAEMQSAIKGY